ncbi:MAG: hypothetical protein E7352_00925 [Clostridiales bacterium]|nr:hypothetical protein [Clostridiales bacterium]
MVYDIANLRVKIENQYEYTTKFCREYLSADQTSPVDLTACVTAEEFAKEKAVSVGFSDGYVENICLYRDICLQLPSRNRMLLHAAILEFDGAAYAFLGRSGAGKSTHIRLWLQNLKKCRVVNGDKPILEEKSDRFIAYGTPWQGKERWGDNCSAPLRGLCFIEQAKENSIVKLTPAETSLRLFRQVLMPTVAQDAAKTLEMLDGLIAKTPAYLLKCDISEQAVETSFAVLTGKNYFENKL